MPQDDTVHLVFDGHNDFLLKIFCAGGLSEAHRFVDGYDGAIDLPKAKSGGFAGGFFAVFIPSPDNATQCDNQEWQNHTYDFPLDEPVAWEEALPVTITQIAILLDLERRGVLRVCRSVRDIRAAMAEGVIAAILHIEGAEAIDPGLETLDLLYAAGLRSLGPVWSRNNIFGHGVPFRFPSSPDIGEGLTEQGVQLVRRCDALGIMVDLSHLNQAGFWDVARHSTKPLVATHSNVHAICPHPRNLTDDQLRAIRESDGMVGLNFATGFLREDGRMIADVPIDMMLRHLDHLIGILGEDRVGLGSDYDGATVPEELTTIADLPKLIRAMKEHGYGDELVAKLCRENWLRVLEKTWGG